MAPDRPQAAASRRRRSRRIARDEIAREASCGRRRVARRVACSLTSMATRTTLGAIDAGSNAIRVVVAELGADRARPHRGRAHPGAARPQRVHRAASSTTRRSTQAVAAFVHFRERFDHHGVGDLSRGRDQRGAQREQPRRAAPPALSRGRHRARGHRGRGRSAPRPQGGDAGARSASTPPRAILDLGGGSLEVNLRDGSAWRGYSLPVGTVRLLETFGLDGAIADAEAGMVRRYTATLMQHDRARRERPRRVAAITGGNAEALAKIFGDGNGDAELRARRAREGAARRSSARRSRSGCEKFGVKRDRAEVLGIAALVFATAARQLGIAASSSRPASASARAC